MFIFETLISQFHIITHRELMDGDKVNREKKREAEEKAQQIKEKQAEAKRRQEEGFVFESDLPTIQEK